MLGALPALYPYVALIRVDEANVVYKVSNVGVSE